MMASKFCKTILYSLYYAKNNNNKKAITAGISASSTVAQITVVFATRNKLFLVRSLTLAVLTTFAILALAFS